MAIFLRVLQLLLKNFRASAMQSMQNRSLALLPALFMLSACFGDDGQVTIIEGEAPRPTLALTGPANGSEQAKGSIQLTLKVLKAPARGYSYKLNDQAPVEKLEALAVGDSRDISLTLVEGMNVARFAVVDNQGEAAVVERAWLVPKPEKDPDPDPPGPQDPPKAPVCKLDDFEPTTDDFEVSLSGTVESTVEVEGRWSNGARSGEISFQDSLPTLRFEATLPLAVGDNAIEIHIKNAGGECKLNAAIKRGKDIHPPVLRIESPLSGASVNGRAAWLRGTITEDTELKKATIKDEGGNEQDLVLTDGHFGLLLPLQAGTNRFFIQAIDASDNSSSMDYEVYAGMRVAVGGAHGIAIHGEHDTVYAWGRSNQGQTAAVQVSTPVYAPDFVRALSETVGDDGSTTTGTTTISARAVYAAGNSSLLIDKKGALWGFGAAKHGGLCLSASDPRLKILRGVPYTDVALPISGIAAVQSISMNGSANFLLTEAGQVFACGKNTDGILGMADTAATSETPVEIPGLSQVIQVQSFSSTAMAVTESGEVYVWGSNKYGLHGSGQVDEEPHPTPTKIAGLPPIASIAGGFRHVLALTRDGRILAWGGNFTKQIGPERQLGRTVLTPYEVALPAGVFVSSVTAASNTSGLTTHEGKIYPWGQNMKGSIGVPGDYSPDHPETAVFGLTGVTDYAQYGLMSIARTPKHVFTWGWSFHGSLGIGTEAADRWSYPTPLPLSFPERLPE